MRVICGVGNLAKGPSAPKVAAIGVFDGVHRGHQAILRRVVAEAKKRKLLSAVVTFDDHPTVFLSPGERTPALIPLGHKLHLFEEAGIDVCYVLCFNRAVASMEAGFFVAEILRRRIRMVSLYVGEDFVFGRGGRGNIRLLGVLARVLSFKLRVLPHLKIGGRIVSSTLIRSLIRRAALKKAARLLGRPVAVWGEVVRGEGRGRRLGFATANLRPHHDVLLPDGIYAARTLLGRRAWDSLAYIGSKPTFAGQGRRSVEVHLLQYRGDLLGRCLQVQFLKKIRKDRRFPSAARLIAQMHRDAKAARLLLH